MAFGIAVILIVVGVAGMLWVLGGGEPNVATDYAAIVDSRAQSVPEPNRAWPLYLEIIEEVGDPRELDLCDAFFDAERGRRPLGELGASVAMRRDLIKRIRRAALMPGLGYVSSVENENVVRAALGEPVESSPAPDAEPRRLLEIGSPQLAPLRGLATVLRADLRVAASAGDGDRVLEDLRGLLGLSAQAHEQGFLICQLVSSRIRIDAMKDLGWVLRNAPGSLSEDQLADCEELVASLDGGGPFSFSYEVERMWHLDTIQRVYSDDGAGNGRICLSDPGRVGKALEPGFKQESAPGIRERIRTGYFRLFSLNRREVTAACDHLWDLAAHRVQRPRRPWTGGPMNEHIAEAETFDLDGPSHDLGMRLLALLMPALGTSFAEVDIVNALQDATRIAIAAERFQRAEGRWPSNASELVPRYLVAAPLDPFSDRALIVLPEDGGVTVYSVGADRDDDGGRHARFAYRWRPADEAGEIEAGTRSEGDWVLFPNPEAER